MRVIKFPSSMPSKIDGLGLLTFLGAENVNNLVGRLSSSSTTDTLPLPAGFVIASDAIRDPIKEPGLALYNITDGVHTIDVAGWFGKWLNTAKVTDNQTMLRIEVLEEDVSMKKNIVIASLWSFAVHVALFLTAFRLGDKWGVANAYALLATGLARGAIVMANRMAADTAALDGLQQSEEVVKTFWTLPDGKTVTIFAPRGVIINVLLSKPKPRNPGE